MYKWKDIVSINGGKPFGYEAEISGEFDIIDGNEVYNCDKFFSALEDTLRLSSTDSIETLLFDNLEVSNDDIEFIGYGIESCGVYKDGVNI